MIFLCIFFVDHLCANNGHENTDVFVERGELRHCYHSIILTPSPPDFAGAVLGLSDPCNNQSSKLTFQSY